MAWRLPPPLPSLRFPSRARPCCSVWGACSEFAAGDNRGVSADLQISFPVTPQEFEEYFELRWKLLRAPWKYPQGSERDDLEDSAQHLTARSSEGRLLGVGRLHLNSEVEAQIRFMAVAEDVQGQGVGRAIVERLEQLATEHGVQRIVLNSRDIAVGFYEKLGYVSLGPAEIVFAAVDHALMEKVLESTE